MAGVVLSVGMVVGVVESVPVVVEVSRAVGVDRDTVVSAIAVEDEPVLVEVP